MRALILVPILAATATAHADVEAAREDIVDMRRGRMPSRSEALGWTEDGAFVFRRTSCVVQDLSDIPSCRVEIDVAKGRRTESHVLFSVTWEIGCAEAFDGPPDPALGCWAIPTDAASTFLAAERELREKLGPLTEGTRTGRRLGNGALAIVEYGDPQAGRRRAALALVKDGRWRALRVIWNVDDGGDEFLRGAPSIDRVERSPDGTSLAIVSSLSHAEDDYYWTSYRVDVVPVP